MATPAKEMRKAATVEARNLANNTISNPWDHEGIATIASKIKVAYASVTAPGVLFDNDEAWRRAVAAVIPVTMLDAIADERREARIALENCVGPAYEWMSAQSVLQAEVAKWHHVMTEEDAPVFQRPTSLEQIPTEVYRHPRKTVIDQVVGLLRGGGLAGVRSFDYRTGTGVDGVPIYEWGVEVYTRDGARAKELLQEAMFPLPLPTSDKTPQA